MSITSYFSFVAAAVMLAIIPGPSILFVLAQTSKGGRSCGLSGSIGTAIGGMFHVLAGSIGFSALIYTSSVAFLVVKTLGAFYLFYLAWRAWREKSSLSLASLANIQLQSDSLKQGVLTEALNPKTALFFLALIPQFIDPASNIAGQFFILGMTSVFLNTSVDFLVVFSADFLLSYLRRSPSAAKSFKYISSAGYFGLGLLALRTSRAA